MLDEPEVDPDRVDEPEGFSLELEQGGGGIVQRAAVIGDDDLTDVEDDGSADNGDDDYIEPGDDGSPLDEL